VRRWHPVMAGRTTAREAVRSSGREGATEVSTQPLVNGVPGVSVAEWQALVTGVRQMADAVAGLSRRMAAVEQQLSPAAQQVSAPQRSSAR
jgi:hypothetical protein